MYARARSGELRHFTGLDDPYEPPRQPELRLETVGQSVEANARELLAMLVERGFVRPD